jgi:hypothetical protein
MTFFLGIFFIFTAGFISGWKVKEYLVKATNQKPRVDFIIGPITERK